MTNTRLSLDKNVMTRINNVLQRAECIDIYGTGISYALAQAAAFKFAELAATGFPSPGPAYFRQEKRRSQTRRGCAIMTII